MPHFRTPSAARPAPRPCQPKQTSDAAGVGPRSQPRPRPFTKRPFKTPLFKTPLCTTRLFVTLALLSLCAHLWAEGVSAQQRRRRPPAGGRPAVVVDERLAALRDAPNLTADLVRRLGRGSTVALTGARSAKGGVTFFRVAVTRRTGGWLQSEAFASPARAGDDERLLRLARGSGEFDRLARARILLDFFPRSPLRPAALLLFGDEAAAAAERLTREAVRRLDAAEMSAGGAPVESYYLNYSGLDRFRRQGVVFTFDAARRRYLYDGAAWREIVRRHPRSPEAEQARLRLSSVASAPR